MSIIVHALCSMLMLCCSSWGVRDPSVRPLLALVLVLVRVYPCNHLYLFSWTYEPTMCIPDPTSCLLPDCPTRITLSGFTELTYSYLVITVKL